MNRKFRLTDLKAFQIGKKELAEKLGIELTVSEQIDLYNWACDYITRDERIYAMDDLDDLLYGPRVSEILERIDLKEFSTTDDYIQFDGYGFLVSRDTGDVTDFYDLGDLAYELILSPDTVRLAYESECFRWILDDIGLIDRMMEIEIDTGHCPDYTL